MIQQINFNEKLKIMTKTLKLTLIALQVNKNSKYNQHVDKTVIFPVNRITWLKHNRNKNFYYLLKLYFTPISFEFLKFQKFLLVNKLITINL